MFTRFSLRLMEVVGERGASLAGTTGRGVRGGGAPCFGDLSIVVMVP